MYWSRIAQWPSGSSPFTPLPWMVMKRFSLLSLILVFIAAMPALAQRKGISWEKAVQKVEAKIEPAEAKPGQVVTFKISISLNPGYYTYPTRQPEPSANIYINKFTLPAPGALVFVGPFQDPIISSKKPNPDGPGAVHYYPDGTTWEFKAVVSPDATPGSTTISLVLNQLQICDENSCLPPRSVPLKEVSASLKVLEGRVDVDASLKDEVANSLKSPKSIALPVVEAPVKNGKEAPVSSPVEMKSVARRLALDRDHAADLKAVLDQLPPPNAKDPGLWRFLATAAAFGFLTLFTPCVFPMVPITVSIFVKQGEKKGTNPLAHALIYAATIVLLLSIAALTLLTTFSRLAVHPVTNVFLGGLFVFLALSLFGMFELTLPNWLANATNDRASKGGYLGTIFMAVSFTVVSFTCVAPFLGGFSGMAASGNFSFFQLTIGALVFALAFASPFFLLAMFPSLIKKLPKSGDWMNMIKVTMGFLELAAALKFFRTAELRWLSPPEYFTYDVVLAAWIAIFGATALYLLGVFKTEHDHEEHDHVGPLRIIFALFALGLAVYLAPALFSNGKGERNRPAGTVYAWVDAFLLPEPSAAEILGSDLPWSGDLRRSLDDARSKGGRVFVDFTGKTCANCKLNEKNVFPKPEIQQLFKQYRLVQLYTDTVPEIFYESDPGSDRTKRDAGHNHDFEQKAFGEIQLPLYVILKPEMDGKTTVVGVYAEGQINNEAAFIEFLKNGLK